MTEQEKIEAANGLKERGTKFLNEGKLSLALNKYNSIGVLLEHTTPIEDDLKAKVETVLIAGWLNCAFVNMKQGETAECIKHCDKVLEKQHQNVKALYRKGQVIFNTSFPIKYSAFRHCNNAKSLSKPLLFTTRSLKLNRKTKQLHNKFLFARV